MSPSFFSLPRLTCKGLTLAFAIACVTGFARLVFAQPDLAVTAAKAAQSGSIIGWGDQVVGGDMSGRFVAVAAGGYHSLGLKNDGSVVAWGDNSDGQCDVPAPNTGFVAVAASGSVDTGIRGHSLGLNNDGSIMAWGNNRGGQCDVPAPNTGFVAVAAGWYHSLGLKNDGSVVAWGYNWSGECDVPAPNTGFVAVAA